MAIDQRNVKLDNVFSCKSIVDVLNKRGNNDIEISIRNAMGLLNITHMSTIIILAWILTRIRKESFEDMLVLSVVPLSSLIS